MADKEKTEEKKTEAPKAEANKVADTAKKVTKKTGKLLRNIVIGVVVFFVAVFAYVTWATSGAVKVADEFLDYLQASNSSQAYALFADEAKEATPEDAFGEAVDRIAPILAGEPSNTGKEISDGTDEAKLANISYDIVGTDGITYAIDIELIEIDGEWKVLNFNSQDKSTLTQ